MVTIYTVPGCSRCALLKKRASELNIEFDESHDVDALIQAGFKTAPVMLKEGKYYTFKEALDLLNSVGA